MRPTASIAATLALSHRYTLHETCASCLRLLARASMRYQVIVAEQAKAAVQQCLPFCDGIACMSANISTLYGPVPFNGWSLLKVAGIVNTEASSVLCQLRPWGRHIPRITLSEPHAVPHPSDLHAAIKTVHSQILPSALVLSDPCLVRSSFTSSQQHPAEAMWMLWTGVSVQS